MSAIKSKFAPTLIPFTAVNAVNGVAGLDASGKISTAQLPAGIAGGLNFKGGFDASTGSYPSSPSNGDLYIVATAGTIGGVVYTVGDLFFYSSSQSGWVKIETSRTSDELPEGTTNLFFTAARAQAAAVINSLAASTTQAPTTTAVNSALALKANAFTRKKERFVLTATDITNQYIIASQLAASFSMTMGVQGLGLTEESLDSGSTGDYLLSTDSGTSHTKITFKNDLATGGASPLAAGDVIYLHYSY